MYVLLVNQADGMNPTDPSSIWTCRLCGCQHYTPIYLNLFTENGEHPLVPTIRRYNNLLVSAVVFLYRIFACYRMLNVSIGDCDKLPTSLCQVCTTKVQELQLFYDNCQETQKMLSIQYGLHQEDIGQAVSVDPTVQTLQMHMDGIDMKDDMQQMQMQQEVAPIQDPAPGVNIQAVQPAVLSADKLLETAIKDTCILSEAEESEDDDSGEEDITDDQSGEQSANEEKVRLISEFNLVTICHKKKIN